MRGWDLKLRFFSAFLYSNYWYYTSVKFVGFKGGGFSLVTHDAKNTTRSKPTNGNPSKLTHLYFDKDSYSLNIRVVSR